MNSPRRPMHSGTRYRTASNTTTLVVAFIVACAASILAHSLWTSLIAGCLFFAITRRVALRLNRRRRSNVDLHFVVFLAAVAFTTILAGISTHIIWFALITVASAALLKQRLTRRGRSWSTTTAHWTRPRS
jgi:predicted PurR-regulated permease PerM